MNEQEIAEKLLYIKSTIKKYVHPCYEDNSGTELYCGCPECGESRPKFYIKMQPPFPVHCFLCNYNGVLNKHIIDELGIHDPVFDDAVLSLTKEYGRSVIRAFSPVKASAKREIHDITSSASEFNLSYFNNRFHTSVSLEELNSKFRGCCDVSGFLAEQHIEADRISDFDLSKSIGFLSSDSAYLICRDTSGLSEMRYHNVKLEKNPEVSVSKFYSIATKIDALSEKTTLVMTEGIFDIIGIYLAKYKNGIPDGNTIFAAGCGKSYRELAYKYIKLGFLDMNLVIYSDNDVPEEFYKDAIIGDKTLAKFKTEVYYNRLSKDTGVPADQIDVVGNRL